MQYDPLPEFRRCPATGRWVIFAPERARRPITLPHTQSHHRNLSAAGTACPFCEGHEGEVPEEVYAIRAAGTAKDSPGWELRVVSNKFPALRPDMSATLPLLDPFFEARPGFGAHEVIIPCREHETNPAKLTAVQYANLLVAYRDRIRTISADNLWHYVQVFQNVGAEAGASLAHLHAQIIALPMVPDAIESELSFAKEYHDQHGVCVYCELMAKERLDRTRILRETEHFVALCPFAPRFSYEFWVMPKYHASHYEITGDAALKELAKLMLDLLAALDAVLAEPAYNAFLHTTPQRAKPNSHYHWHWEVIPRTARAAGFEWGSGCFLNAVPPEKAAHELRTALTNPRS